MIQTIYQPVPGYADLYAGMDASIVHGEKGRELKRTLRPDGYRYVRIPNLRQELAHRLIAAAFLGACPEGMEVRHGVMGKADNSPGNLCYGSPQDNTQDAMRDGTHQGAKMSAKVECSRGHEYSPENTYIHPTTGSRHCRTCRTDYLREYNANPEYKARRRAQYKANKLATQGDSPCP